MASEAWDWFPSEEDYEEFTAEKSKELLAEQALDLMFYFKPYTLRFYPFRDYILKLIAAMNRVRRLRREFRVSCRMFITIGPYGAIQALPVVVWKLCEFYKVMRYCTVVATDMLRKVQPNEGRDNGHEHINEDMAPAGGGGGETTSQGTAAQPGRSKSRKSSKASKDVAPASSSTFDDPPASLPHSSSSSSSSTSTSEQTSSRSSALFRVAQTIENLKCAVNDPEQHPGRFPKNDPSIDLAYLNIALGQTLFGEGEPSIEATHGAFHNIQDSVPRRASGKKEKEKEKGKGKTTEVSEQEYRVKLSDSTAQAACDSGSTGGGGSGSGSGNGVSITTPGSVAMQRQPSSTGLNQQQQQQQAQQQQQPPSPGNGVGNNAAPGMGATMPTSIVHAGQQMDINMVLSKLQELIATNDANRKQTSLLVKNAEKVAQRAFTADGASNAQTGISEAREPLAAKAKIADLEKKLFTSEALVQVLRREQRENGKLIGEYEQALDKVVGMLRDFAAAQTEEKAALARRYLGMLQAERNEHQQTRFQRDEYLAKVMELADNIRIAYRLRCEESVPDLEIVAGLQTEVRAYRNAMGMEAEKREEETGWPVLRNVRDKEGEGVSGGS